MRSFCSAKASLIFSTKNICAFGYKAVKHLTSWPLNELVKLTMLWTTGPRLSAVEVYAKSPVVTLRWFKSILWCTLIWVRKSARTPNFVQWPSTILADVILKSPESLVSLIARRPKLTLNISLSKRTVNSVHQQVKITSEGRVLGNKERVRETEITAKC